MKTLFKSAIMLLTCGLFFACSNDEVAPKEKVETFKSDKAYFAVTLKYSNGAETRALTNEYDEGTNAEAQINTLDFFFYDGDGNYSDHTTLSPNGAVDGTAKDNIEWNEPAVVVLNNLNGKNYPKYVTVLINLPTTVAAAIENLTIEDANNYITNNLAATEAPFVRGATGGSVYKNGQALGTGKGFLMTSVATTMENAEAWKNYAQPITADNFGEWDGTKDPSTITPLDDIIPAECYVERVVSKATVKLGDGLVVVADEYVAADGTTVTANVYAIGTTGLYVAFTGWNLTATAKKFQAFKQIRSGATVAYDPTSTISQNYSDASTNEYWINKSNFHRTAWGEGAAYDLDGTVTNFASSEANVAASQMLSYVNYNNLVPTVTGSTAVAISADNSLYCNPNTNSLAVLKGHFTARATSVMVGAVLIEKETVGGVDTYKAASRYRWTNGTLYTAVDYLNKVLTTYPGVLPYMRVEEVGTGTITYKQASAADFKHDDSGKTVLNLSNLGDGNVCLYINAKPTVPAGYKLIKTSIDPDPETFDVSWYVRSGAAEPYTYTAKDYSYGNTKYIFGAGSGSSSRAEAYNGGMMYYVVPIEHNLHGSKTYLDADYMTVACEGDYGVVRNHSYLLTVNKVENIGHGVFDPDKEIVTDDDMNKKYYLGASLKVLSWRNVTQNVNF